MFEYGNLKFIQNEDKSSWYFICKEDDKYTEKELGKGDFLVILNQLRWGKLGACIHRWDARLCPKKEGY